MDEVCMLRWVDEILKPYLKVNPPPPGIVPVILLDAYRCHMMASVTDAIAELGIEIIHIPGGCTGLTQPPDVGINKPFKSRVHVLWEEWMINEIHCTGLVYVPTREDISGWVAEVVWGLNGKNLMPNAWRKTGYDWFLRKGWGTSVTMAMMSLTMTKMVTTTPTLTRCVMSPICSMMSLG